MESSLSWYVELQNACGWMISQLTEQPSLRVDLVRRSVAWSQDWPIPGSARPPHFLLPELVHCELRTVSCRLRCLYSDLPSDIKVLLTLTLTRGEESCSLGFYYCCY